MASPNTNIPRQGAGGLASPDNLTAGAGGARRELDPVLGHGRAVPRWGVLGRGRERTDGRAGAGAAEARGAWCGASLSASAAGADGARRRRGREGQIIELGPSEIGKRIERRRDCSEGRDRQIALRPAALQLRWTSRVEFAGGAALDAGVTGQRAAG